MSTTMKWWCTECMKPAYANELQKDYRVVRTGTKEGQIGRFHCSGNQAKPEKGTAKYCGRQTAFMWGTLDHVKANKDTWKEDLEAKRAAKKAAKAK
mmetsp:Transcript_140152/g.244096  ORF Transcript_140152/g.244096 Transcript_140152/m.244096 type:complete len:96 (-) Transcript_140152:208-495(-)